MFCYEFKCINTVALLKKKAIVLLKHFLNCLNKAALEGFARNYNSIQTLPSPFKRKIMTAQSFPNHFSSNLSKQGMNISSVMPK